MNEEKCPFCGADSITPITFDCWTRIIQADPGSQIDYHRGMLCFNRQIAQLQECLEAWRNYPRYKHETTEEWETALQKLKDLGEL